MEAVANYIVLAAFWAAGSALALLGWCKVRDYKCYENPRAFLAVGVFLCVAMSWAVVWLALVNGQFELPDWLYHECERHADITFREEYLDEYGNASDPRRCAEHRTYRVWTCRRCGRKWEDRLQ